MFFRAIARPLLASWFIYGGIESVLEPERRAQRAEPVVKPLLVEAGLEEVKVTDLVKVHGAASIAAASILALSRTPKTAGLALAGLAAVTVVAGRPFWREQDDEARAQERDRFMMNLSLFGGTLLAATAGHGRHHVSRAKAKKVRASKAKAHKVEAKAKGKNHSLTLKRGK
jgi:putative oxidoreductase